MAAKKTLSRWAKFLWCFEALRARLESLDLCKFHANMFAFVILFVLLGPAVRANAIDAERPGTASDLQGKLVFAHVVSSSCVLCSRCFGGSWLRAIFMASFVSAVPARRQDTSWSLPDGSMEGSEILANRLGSVDKCKWECSLICSEDCC